VLDALNVVATKIKITPETERQSVLLQELSKIKFPSRFILPLDARIQVRGIALKKCKYMDSKKLPLWVVFENAEVNADAVQVIFKSGDDLRQDVLTLQMIRLMDRFWKEQGGLDLQLLPYKAMATGDQAGLIEVVLNAETTANINKQLGGAFSVWKPETLYKWLKAENPNEKLWSEVVQRFSLSCAGYCVATYVLGIGDRHNDNIMVTRSGNLFHIDFGHFLGNFKSKLGIKRERAPFIFTPQFAYVIGGKGTETFKFFEQTCSNAYNIIRKHARLFIVLFQMMLSTGIPELQKPEDIFYLRDAFSLDLKDEDAANKFVDLIQVALNTTTTLINDTVHIMVHNK
jgi:phosphatidylinositol kinase/protein kinase (PI-3  family)